MHTVQASIRHILHHFIMFPFVISSLWRRIRSKVRFRERFVLHPGHVSYLIGATPLHCLPCTIVPRRLTHCDYASRRCLFRARDFISFHLSPLISFSYSISFVPFIFFLSLHAPYKIDWSSPISQLDRKSQGPAFGLSYYPVGFTYGEKDDI